ncbi:hypothetical protein [Gimesia algae]|uniref:L-lactate dehydrogenase n=1 Tax=Gimesia algae TaxID=2527971 RepID=A0A517VEY8_9PLAN|nr:hypothetical protein [Gimesia algae]QDT91574.1 L-lactate dehydrogenase [Gimesia algae]
MKVGIVGSGLVAGKGTAYYDIGCALARIVKAIVNDHRVILTVKYAESRTCSPRWRHSVAAAPAGR